MNFELNSVKATDRYTAQTMNLYVVQMMSAL